MSAPILYESHMHTPLCKHAVGQPEEYAAVAEERGLKGILVTCHGPCEDGWSPYVRMSIDELDEYVSMVKRARNAWAGRVDVRLGLESEYAPGMETWLEKLHEMAEFHHVLGSVHPHLPDYQELYLDGSTEKFQRIYFDHLARAAETGLFDTISHPDLVKNYDPGDWDMGRIEDGILSCLDRIAGTGVAMELNTSGKNKSFSEFSPSATILEWMQERGIPVVLGADAHQPERIGEYFLEALDEVESAGYSHVSFFLERQRQDIPIQQARSSLNAPGDVTA